MKMFIHLIRERMLTGNYDPNELRHIAHNNIPTCGFYYEAVHKAIQTNDQSKVRAMLAAYLIGKGYEQKYIRFVLVCDWL